MNDLSQEYIAKKVQHLLRHRELDSAALMRRLGRRIADLEKECTQLKAERRELVEEIAVLEGKRKPLKPDGYVPSFHMVEDDDDSA